jgi:hypothetical protein
MASSYTGLGTELMTTGENAGTWGTTTNTNLQIIEQISGGYTAQSIAGSAQTTTLSVSDGSTGAVLAHRVIEFTGTITGNQIVTIPLDVQQLYVIKNGTSGAYTVQFKYVSGSGSSVTFAATDKGTKLLYAAADHASNPNIVDSGLGSTGAYDLDGNQLTLDPDADTSITASTDDQIDFEISGADDFTMTANAFNVLTGSHVTFADSANAKFGTGNDMLLYHDGSNSYITNAVGALKIATETSGIAVTIGHTTSETTIADNLTVTGTLTGTLATAAQGSVTSLGTLTTLTVDNVITNGATIGHTSDTDLMTLADGVLTVAGELDATTLDISGNADIDGTTNLDAVDIDGAVQIDAAVTVGVDDTGYDVKFFGNTASAYMLWDTSADDLVLAGAAGIDLAGDIDVDGTANLDAVDIDGAVQIDSTVTVGVDDTGHDVKFFGATSGAYMLWDESTDDLVLAGAAKLYLYDAGGGEYISSSGSALTIASGGTAWELPAADGSDGQYLKTDGSGNLDWATLSSGVSLSGSTDNTIATVTGSNALAGEANLTFDGTDFLIAGAGKIQLRDTGLYVASNADGDLDVVSDGTAVDSINLESAGGITLDAGTAGSGIIYEDDGTEMLRIHNSSSDVIVESKVSNKDIIFKVNDGGSDTEVARFDGDVSAFLIASGKKLMIGAAEEYLSGDGTDISFTVGSGGDINIGSDIGLTFGNDGEKIEGDGTDLTISGNNINLTATADVVIPANVGITFGSGEKIEGDSTDLTVTSGAKINLTATSDVHLPNSVGMVFGDAGEKIEGDGTDLTISSSALANIDAGTDIVLDADGGDIFFKDDGTTFGSATNTSGNLIIKSGTTTAATFSGANVTFAGTINGGGTLTTGGNVVIPDAGNIGSASDTDSIAIASNGVVTFSQAPVFPDGSLALADLDIDGGTDINAALVDADLIIVDDGAGGTNRKATLSRLMTYVNANSTGIGMGKAIAAALVFG